MQEDYRGKIKPTKKVMFKVGDHVRIAIAQGKFGRGYDKKSNEEIYEIVEVSTKLPKVLYKIASLNGDAVIGKFYQGQLTKVLNQDEFIIEKVLKKQRHTIKLNFLGTMNLSGFLKKILQTLLKTFNDFKVFENK